MIRFNCPHCNRYYELHPAMANLPLLCKQCGERITPPEAVPEPPPPAPVPAKAKPVPPVAEVVASPPRPEPVVKPLGTPSSDGGKGGVLVAQPDVSPDAGFSGDPTPASPSDISRPEAAVPSDPKRPGPATPVGEPLPAPAERRRKRPVKVEPEAPPATKSAATRLPFIADLVAFVVLVGSGMLLGELLVRKSTGQVLSEAGSAPKFPPVELLLWAAPPVMLALVYLLLSGRQQSFGAWVRRRAAK